MHGSKGLSNSLLARPVTYSGHGLGALIAAFNGSIYIGGSRVMLRLKRSEYFTVIFSAEGAICRPINSL